MDSNFLKRIKTKVSAIGSNMGLSIPLSPIPYTKIKKHVRQEKRRQKASISSNMGKRTTNK